jgi:hypothetical protein
MLELDAVDDGDVRACHRPDRDRQCSISRVWRVPSRESGPQLKPRRRGIQRDRNRDKNRDRDRDRDSREGLDRAAD